MRCVREAGRSRRRHDKSYVPFSLPHGVIGVARRRGGVVVYLQVAFVGDGALVVPDIGSGLLILLTEQPDGQPLHEGSNGLFIHFDDDGICATSSRSPLVQWHISHAMFRNGSAIPMGIPYNQEIGYDIIALHRVGTSASLQSITDTMRRQGSTEIWFLGTRRQLDASDWHERGREVQELLAERRRHEKSNGE